MPTLRIAGSSKVFVGCGIGIALGGGSLTACNAFSLPASTSSTISVALIVNSGTYLPLAGHVTRSREFSNREERAWCSQGGLPFRNVKLLPGAMPLTTPLNWAPGGELSVTSMVSPINVFDMSGAVSCIPPSQDPGKVSVIQWDGKIGS